MAVKVGMVSLGCPKNQVDAEIMLSFLAKGGFEICADENKCEVIIVNTCGFIGDAKQEAIDNIIELGEIKGKGNLKKIIVTGCLAERYKEEILKEMPEVDAVVGIGENKNICEIIEKVLKNESFGQFSDKCNLLMDADRLLTSPPYTAYLRIADGCDNCCTYCAIPKIRGAFRSRKMENVLLEAKDLAKNGAKEIILIAQDTTRYGQDLYGEYKLPELLDELQKIDGIEWIRILYAYPDKITDELISAMKRNSKVLHYIDIPMQHASDKILSAMNRKGDSALLESVVEKLRAAMPDITIRTTFIVGFPGESEEDFTVLAEFVQKQKFNRMGAFKYSPEEDTPAAEFENQIDEDVKERRLEVIMAEQSVVNDEIAENQIGTVKQVLVEGYDRMNKCYFGRSEMDAPDIDGKVYFMSEKSYTPGEFVTLSIYDRIDYDLLGEEI
ncbi:MAG: 30S ribosomal protein S12 methylthiotransferase RimO [Clostridia bacterium]|nr:30S ribosomal protein S12 methylthiotransferase RimO [Clostridia bacterium]